MPRSAAVTVPAGSRGGMVVVRARDVRSPAATQRARRPTPSRRPIPAILWAMLLARIYGSMEARPKDGPAWRAEQATLPAPCPVGRGHDLDRV